MAIDVTTLSVKVESKGIDDAAKSLDALGSQAERTEKAVGKLTEKMANSSASIAAIKASMDQMKGVMQKSFPTDGAVALNKALTELSTTLKTIKGKNINVDINAIGRESEVARKGVASLNQSLRDGHNIFQMVGKSLYSLRNLLGGTMLAGAMIEATKSTIDLADSWTLMQSKLKMQMGVGADVNKVQMQLVESSLQMKIPLESMVTLYSRLVPAMKDFGINAESAMRVTETMAAALKASGATGAETASVMLQFSQSMAAGRLNGAEFNAVAEGAPVILRLLSKELGVTRGELKKMAADGQLSTDILTIVLEKYHKQLTDQAKSVPDTVGASFEYLKTQTAVYIGQLNEATGITGLFSAGIKGFADNLQLLGDVFKYVAIGGITLYTGSLVKSIATSMIANAAAKEIAVSMGVVQVASGGAATGIALLDKALTFIAKNPVIVTLAVIAAGAMYLYDRFQETKKEAEAFDNAMAKANGAVDAADKINGYSEAIRIAQLEMGKADLALENLLAARKNTTSAIEIARLNAEIETQREKLAQLTKGWHKAKEAKDNYTDVLSAEEVKKQTSEIDKQIEMLRAQNAAGETWTKTQKDIYQKQKDINELKNKTGGADPRILAEQEKQLNSLKELNKEEQIQANLKKANKKATKEGESLEKKYAAQLNAANAFIDKMEEEAGLRRKLTEAEKEAAKIQAFLDANKAKGSAVKEMQEMRQKILDLDKQRIQNLKDLEQEQIAYNKSVLDMKAAEEYRVASEALQEQIDLQDLANKGIEQSSLTSLMHKQKMEEEAIAAVKLANSFLEVKQASVFADSRLSDAESDKQVAAIQAEIDANNRKIAQYEKLIPLQKKLIESTFKSSQIKMLDIGRTPGEILAEGFGNAGKAIGGMIDAYDKFGEEAKKVNSELKAQEDFLRSKGMKDDSKEMIAVRKAAAEKSVQITAGMFANMSGLAKGYFNENSKGYKALEAAEKTFRTIEMALALKSHIEKMSMMATEVGTFILNSTKAVATAVTNNAAIAASAAPAAITSAAIQPGPAAFVGFAAMAALVAGLGVMVKGGKSSPNVSAQRQETQGSGSVFGEPTAKSESITKALENLSENSDISLKYNEGMLNALKNIEYALVGVTKLVVRSGVQTTLGSVGGSGNEKLNMAASSNEIVKTIGTVLPGLNAIVGALFSVKKSVVDSGFIQNAQTFAEVLSGGLYVMGYTDIETKKKRAGRTKTSTETNLSELSDELQSQFSNIILGMGNSVKEAAKILKMDGDGFTNTLNSFVVDLGRISIQGMDAKQIQETLTNVFSKMGDDMAKAVLPGLDKFQDVGEGYLETLIRVSSTVATVDGIFDSIGQTMNVTGIAGVEAKMSLAELAGGLSDLSRKVNGFYENFYTEQEKTANKTRIVTEEFKRLGIEMIDLNAGDARIKFRDIVNRYRDTDVAVYTSLLNIQEAVNDLTPAFSEVAEAASFADKKLELTYQVMELEGKSTEVTNLKRIAVLKELEAMDASLVPLQQRIYKLQDEKAALDGLKNSSQKAFSVLEKSVNNEKKILKKNLEDKVEVINAAKGLEDARYEAEKTRLAELKSSAETAWEAIHNSQVTSLNASLDSVTKTRDNIKQIFDGLTSTIDKLKASTETYSKQAYSSAQDQLDSALMLAKTAGILPDAERFSGVLETLSSLDKSGFSSSFDFERQQLRTAGKLSELQGIAGGRLSQADATVEALERNIRAVESQTNSATVYYDNLLTDLENNHKDTIGKYDEQIKELNTLYETDVEYLDSILQNAKDQLDIANGTYTEIKGINLALQEFNAFGTAYINAQAEKEAVWEQIGRATAAISTIELPSLKVKDEETAAALDQLRQEIAAQNRSIATSSMQTAKVLTKWDGDGQPTTRSEA